MFGHIFEPSTQKYDEVPCQKKAIKHLKVKNITVAVNK
jgi:hypothetical protein